MITTVKIIILLLKSILFCSGQHDALVVRYRFAGDLKDATGNHLDATIHGITWTDDKDGNSQGAVEFNSSVDYIEFPPMIINGLVDYTVTFWAQSLN